MRMPALIFGIKSAALNAWALYARAWYKSLLQEPFTRALQASASLAQARSALVMHSILLAKYTGYCASCHAVTKAIAS